MKKLLKVFNIPLWSLICIFFAIMFTVFMLAEGIMLQYESWINNYLKINPYSRETQVGEDEDVEYYKSDYTDFVDSEGHIYYKNQPMRDNSMKAALEAAADGTVLLKNNGALPLKEGAGVTFFGGDCIDYLHHGTGSGKVPIKQSETLKSTCEKAEYGLKVNDKVWNAYLTSGYKRGYYAGVTSGGFSDGNYVYFSVDEVPYSKISSAVEQSIDSFGDAAVMLIARDGGENADVDFTENACYEDKYTDLSRTEAAVIEKLIELRKANRVKKVILMINTGNAMQFKNIRNLDVDAILWVGLGGSASYGQIAALLSGKASPYGRLTDTYVYDNDSAPATENFGDFIFTKSDGVPKTEKYTHNTRYVVYQEGIYVGYRYYETRYEDYVLGRGSADGKNGVKAGSGSWKYSDEVAYPFGYGASYTTFEYSGFKAEKKRDGSYDVTLKVTNTGGAKGRDVVQVYLQKPYTEYDKSAGIEKAAVELVGFKKTRELDKNESDTITVNVGAYEFKTYDSYNQKSYIVEKGDYYLAVGSDAHNAVNNILMKKKSRGESVDTGKMFGDGSAAFAEYIEVKKDDFTTYKTSPFTDKNVENRFDNADVNLYKGTKGQEIVYLSRSNWNGTYPSAVTLTCTDPDMVLDMQYGEYPDVKKGDTMPKFGEVTSPLGKLILSELMDLKYDDPTWDDFLNQLTWEDASMLVTDGANINAPVDSLGVPEMLTDDGPCGIRQSRNVLLGTNMAFPSNGLIAATWDVDIANNVSDAFGMEIMHAGYTGIWGTGANIHRTAYSGRNWEYFSEDGFLSGKLFSAQTQGLQKRGIIVYTKHFALNDQERNRCGGTVWANEQTIREIYLKAFEAGVTEGKANGMMSSFTRIGCTWAGRHSGLLTGILRDEWGFIGVCETDAKAGVHQWNDNAGVNAVIAGQDLWLGSGSKTAFDDYRDNATVAKAIREACHRILYTRLHSNAMNGTNASTRIIYNTPWWVNAVTAFQIASGVLMGLSFAITVASVVLYILKRKKNKGEIV